MTTKLINSQGKILYKNQENIQKAQKRRKDVTYCKGLLKYSYDIAVFKRNNQREVTI